MEIKEMDRDELKQLIREGIEENFCCTGEDGARSLEHQLDRIERHQKQWVKHVNESLSPDLLEIRNTLREMGNNNESKDRS
jgi:hypothetical protein